MRLALFGINCSCVLPVRSDPLHDRPGQGHPLFEISGPFRPFPGFRPDEDLCLLDHVRLVLLIINRTVRICHFPHFPFAMMFTAWPAWIRTGAFLLDFTLKL